MAIELKRQLILNVGQMVQGQIDIFTINRNAIRARKDSEFYRKVIDLGLSVEEQAGYYKGRVADEEKKSVPDHDYINALKERLSETRKLVRAEKFYNEYRISFELLKTSQKSIDDHIDFLKGQLSGAVDQDLKAKIQDVLSKAEQEKFTIRNNILTNKVTFALADKKKSTLTETIDKVRKARNQADVAGNEELATSFDLYLQSLQSALNKTMVDDTVHQMELDMMDKPFSPIGMLDRLSAETIKASTDEIPLTINGKRYGSMAEYWQLQLSDYVDNHFFTLVSGDMKEKLAAAKTQLSPVLESELTEQMSVIDSLRHNQDLAAYMEKIDNLSLDIAATGVEGLNDKILADYDAGRMGDTSEANITNSMVKLSELNKKYNVDISSGTDKIFNDVIGKKGPAAQSLADIYQEHIAAGKSASEAWSIANASVSVLDIPHKDILEKEPKELAEETVTAVEKREAGKPSPYDITTAKIKTEQPKVSAPEKIEKPLIEKGELIPDVGLLKWVKPEDITREGKNIYLTKGATVPYRHIKTTEEFTSLQKTRQPDDFVKTSSGKIFIKI